MTKSLPARTAYSQPLYIIAAILISGICWYFSFDLSGDFWYLIWIAPIPVLVVVLHANGKQTFFIAFVAYLIGRLSWFPYLNKVATLVPAIIFTLIIPLIFAVIMLITRRIVLKANAWYGIFAFPVLYTLFEFLMIQFSSDGSAGSIAYTQSNFLPVVQLASVTGLPGISFIITLFPSSVALAWYYQKERNTFQNIIGGSAVIIVLSLLYGFIRLEKNDKEETVKAGMVVLEERYHNITQHPDIDKEKVSATMYLDQVQSLARQGATIIVFPERAININKENETDIIDMFSQVAKQLHIYLVIGYTNFRTSTAHNSTLVINNEGKLLVDYNKVHLVTGLENQFVPGKETGLFDLNNSQVGTAICKDLDFPGYIKQYGKSNSGILFIPAWDFETDDWAHSRMAIMRGVENGFSEVRTARQGRLTISDGYGRVTAEASSAKGNAIVLMGDVGIKRLQTFYTQMGDWFGIIICIAAVGFIFFLLIRKKQPLG